MTKGVYAGTFDPFTAGHLDIVARSLTFCQELVIAIGINSLKTTMFTVEERLDQIKNVIDNNRFLKDKDIKIISFKGLSVDFLKEEKANVIVRGIRNVSDFEYEINVANINKVLDPSIETIFLPTSPNLAVVSSSMVKEIARWGGDISQFVPHNIAKAVYSKLGFFQARVQ